MNLNNAQNYNTGDEIEAKSDTAISCQLCGRTLFDTGHAINHIASYHTIQAKEFLHKLHEEDAFGRHEIELFLNG